MRELREGLQINSFEINSEDSVHVEQNGVKAIFVTMQEGQMGMVPWIQVIFKDHSYVLYNAANVLSITPDTKITGEKSW